jgi:hypothetical protein
LILCTSCKRLWPKGTDWCGNCQATLGKRYCLDGHESPLYANCCLTCGSPRLTPGVGCLKVRPFFILLGMVAGCWVLPSAVVAFKHGFNSFYSFLLNEVLSRLIVWGLISWLVGLALGERTARAIGDLWLSLFRLFISAVGAAARWVGSLFRERFRPRDLHRSDRRTTAPPPTRHPHGR